MVLRVDVDNNNPNPLLFKEPLCIPVFQRMYFETPERLKRDFSIYFSPFVDENSLSKVGELRVQFKKGRNMVQCFTLKDLKSIVKDALPFKLDGKERYTSGNFYILVNDDQVCRIESRQLKGENRYSNFVKLCDDNTWKVIEYKNNPKPTKPSSERKKNGHYTNKRCEATFISFKPAQ